MPTLHVSWGSIELLHNVVRTLTFLNEQGSPFPVVRYRSKVKVHGSNCAVQVGRDGVVAQSRTSLLTPEADYKGFAAWVRSHEPYFREITSGIVVFGEWCGPGVEKGMAISKIANKIFAVFAVQLGDRVVFEPDAVRTLLPAGGAPENLFVLPWEGAEISIDYASKSKLELVAADLNERVLAVEREDPWVKKTFDVSGIGEGLVLYPVEVGGAPPNAEPAALAQLMFKAKGEKHRTAATKTAVQVEASVVASIEEFVALLVTETRLEQGLATACGGSREPKNTAAFLAWVTADVKKESVAELEVSGLAWAQVEKPVQVRARTWFLGR